jgi:hypothetical protein
MSSQVANRKSTPSNRVRCGYHLQSRRMTPELYGAEATIGSGARFLEAERLTRGDDDGRVMKQAIE